MKKKLEADLISIAHRILQMKNRSDINQLYAEVQQLQEKLGVLKFVEAHFGEAKPTIGQLEVETKLDTIFAETPSENTISAPISELETSVSSNINAENIEILADAIPQEMPLANEEIAANLLETEVEETNADFIIEENLPETAVETLTEETATTLVSEENLPETSIEETTPSFIPAAEALLELELNDSLEIPKTNENMVLSFEELFGQHYDESHFVKKEDLKEKSNPLDFELPKVEKIESEIIPAFNEIEFETKGTETQEAAVISKNIKTINIGLNDRIAFVKHLFGNSNEDYNRVLNQLLTQDSFEEAQNFIEKMIKPDYNNWEGKEDYAERFLQIIEKKFL